MKINTMQMLFVGLAVVMWSAPAGAQSSDWAQKMFEKLDHDFGVVARGSDARYRLNLTNKYREPVHISSVSTTCGCTAAKPSKDTLVSHESAYIEITMDTKKFQHEKTSSVTVIIDRPLYAEVRIPIKAWIRTDVVLTPGGAVFDSVTLGADAERKIGVAYAGRGNWKIKDVVSKNPNVSVKVVETRRNSINVNYDLVVTLKGSAPKGELREQLTLVTDDTDNPYIPVIVEGRVEAEYSVNPDLVSFGNLNPGERKTVNIVVRNSMKKPFSIERIESETSSGVFEVRLPKEPRAVHVVPLTVIAPSEPGTLSEEFTVTIGGNHEPVTFKALGKIGSSAGPTTAQKDKP
jgi:hypothetical protein